ncbi:MAG: uroporphyrinogen decarboxylase family protein [Armatimonadota bacterium]|nr:uroporphyrinogen decarboxylase family protein [Armatimonadota bacterium]
MDTSLLIPGFTHVKASPDFSRLRKAILREGEPDRLPFLELFADAEIKQAILGRPVQSMTDEVEFWLRLGYDRVQAPIGVRLEMGRETAPDTARELNRQERGWVTQHTSLIGNWEQYEKYNWPTTDEVVVQYVEEANAALPEGMGITVQSSGVLENVMWLMGYEGLSIALYDNPELVRAMFDRIGALFLACYEAAVDMEGVGGAFFGEDMGFKTATMISPDALRQYLFPWLKRIVDVCHEHGKFFILHACGNLEEIMDDLIDYVGIDAKHSFEDAIEPVASFKRRYGDRIGVVGGVDVDVLARRSVDDVRLYVRKVIEDCAPGGGYVLGTGNSVANYIRVENYLAMLEEGWKRRVE